MGKANWVLAGVGGLGSEGEGIRGGAAASEAPVCMDLWSGDVLDEARKGRMN